MKRLKKEELYEYETFKKEKKMQIIRNVHLLQKIKIDETEN